MHNHCDPMESVRWSCLASLVVQLEAEFELARGWGGMWRVQNGLLRLKVDGGMVNQGRDA